MSRTKNAAGKKRFIDALMARMTLREKIGQMNTPRIGALSTTGAAVTQTVMADAVRRGDVGMTAGQSREDRLAIQTLAVTESPNKIPVIFSMDVDHGHRTIFPIPLGLAASWNMELIERTARAAAAEATTEGLSMTHFPMLDLSDDARWGRVAEGPGEDPYLASRIAGAYVRGYQGDDPGSPETMFAVAKHFAGYGFARAGRDYATVDASAYKMHNIILRPFLAAVKAGVRGIMVAFNDISGVPATAHKPLLTGLLRKAWDYKGLVVTDYTAVMELVNHGTAQNLKDAARQAVNAGITTDLVSEACMAHLEDLVREGRVPEAVVDANCRLVLEAKYDMGLFDDPFRYFDAERRARVVLSPGHIALSRAAAAESCVLLTNKNNALPLPKNNIKIALVGPLAGGEAARANMQGTWAINAQTSRSVTVEEGLRAAAGDNVEIICVKGANITDDPDIAARLDVHNRANPTAPIDPHDPDDMIAEAVAAAMQSDVIVACVGEAKEYSGESSTRDNIDIPACQLKLLKALKATGKKLILVTMSGRPLSLEWEAEHTDAILHAWFAGTEGGNGIADLLFGDKNPSGRLPMSFPRTAGQCPIAYYDPVSGRPHGGAGCDVYGDGEKGPDGLNVFRKFTTACIVEGSHKPLFPFGHGLGYSPFAYGPVTLDKTSLRGDDDVLRASVTVKNTGAHTGTETVQLYITDPKASMVRPARELKGFEKITLQPGEERTVTFTVTPEHLSFIKARSLTQFRTVWEAGDFIIQIGPNAETHDAATVRWDKSRRPRAVKDAVPA